MSTVCSRRLWWCRSKLVINRSRHMDFLIQKIEAFLRLCATLVLALTAFLLGLNTQSKVIFYIRRRITFRDLNALEGLLYVVSLAAAYHLLQLSRCIFSTYCLKGNLNKANKYLAWFWISYLLDQIVVYMVFAANSAALEHAVLVLTGEKDFQWMKWCDRFTRFCFQVGGALLCGYIASVLTAFITFISAFNLFRLYSPQKFLHLKHS